MDIQQELLQVIPPPLLLISGTYRLANDASDFRSFPVVQPDPIGEIQKHSFRDRHERSDRKRLCVHCVSGQGSK